LLPSAHFSAKLILYYGFTRRSNSAS
jgi:hypothetical protein